MSDFRILLIGDSDSQLLACEALCQSPSFQGIDVTINVIPREGTPDLILSRIGRLGRLLTGRSRFVCTQRSRDAIRHRNTIQHGCRMSTGCVYQT